MDSEAASRADRLKQAQAAMQAGRFAEASQLAAQLLAADSDDQDGLYMAAVAARYLGGAGQAILAES